MPTDTRVTFYDVQPEDRWPLIAKMAEAAWGKGKRLVIHCANNAIARELDEYLWVFREDAFIPPERIGPNDDTCPDSATIRIVSQATNTGEADVLVMESPVSLELARRYATVIDMVDHRDESGEDKSRQRFKAWRAQGVTPLYKKYP